MLNVRYQTSNVMAYQCQIFNIKCQMSKYKMSNDLWQFQVDLGRSSQNFTRSQQICESMTIRVKLVSVIYYQSVSIELAHRLYTDVQYFFRKSFFDHFRTNEDPQVLYSGKLWISSFWWYKEFFSSCRASDFLWHVRTDIFLYYTEKLSYTFWALMPIHIDFPFFIDL